MGTTGGCSMGIRVKDLKTDTVYYDSERNEILHLESLSPLWGEDGLFVIWGTLEGTKVSCEIPEATYVSLVELGEL